MKVFTNFMKQFILIISIVFASISVWGQDTLPKNIIKTYNGYQIHGYVIDSSGKGIESATVYENNTTNGMYTYPNGEYLFTVKSLKNSIEFSCLGYISKQIEILKIPEKVILEASRKNEIKIIFAIQQNNAEKNTQNQSIKPPILITPQALQGKAAGVQVRANSGTPGAGMDIVVRGRGRNYVSKPLYVVDGIAVGSELNIEPKNIKSKTIQCSYDWYRGTRDTIILITTIRGDYGESFQYPDYKKGSYNDFTKQIEQQLQPNAQKIGFTGSIDVRCSMDAKGALRVDNIPANVDYNFKQLLIQSIESDDEWTPATYDGKPIEMSFLFEFEF